MISPKLTIGISVDWITNQHAIILTRLWISDEYVLDLAFKRLRKTKNEAQPI